MADDVMPPPDGGALKGDDAAYLRDEAQKAFKARDTLKTKLRTLEESGLVITEDQRERYRALEETAAKTEEDRKKKAGEFDSLRESLVKKYETDLEAERQRVAKADAKYRAKLVSAAFSGAVDLFGASPSAKTVLPPDIAESYFGRYVEIQQDDETSDEVLVVKDRSGHVILDAKTGKPASFAAGMAELIETMPQRDQVLRGSGKTGSGSSGGVGVISKDMDLGELTRRVQRGDKKAIEAMKQRQAEQGEMTVGRRPRVA